MARRTPTSTRAGAGSRAGTPAADQPGEAALAAAGKGLAFTDVLVLSSTVLLIAAFLMTDYLRGVKYGTGLFFQQ